MSDAIVHLIMPYINRTHLRADLSYFNRIIGLFEMCHACIDGGAGQSYHFAATCICLCHSKIT